MRARINATPTERDGIKFPSKLEATRWDELTLLSKQGKVVTFLRQPRFDLGGGTKYTPDFMIFWSGPGPDVTVTVEEVKGRRDDEGLRRFKRNKKQMENRYPFKVELWP